MRLFIAVPLGQEVRKNLTGLIRHLRATGADYKWVEPQNLHVTLAFLGETAEDRLPALKAVIAAAAKRSKFTLTTGAPGSFESRGRKGILWAGLTDGADELAALYHALTTELARAGFKVEDRPFTAHITVGRMRSQRNSAALTEALRTAAEAPHPASCSANRLALIESKLTREGPTYTVLHEETLRA